MHIVFLNQYYPPDAAPTGVVLRDLADGMARKGHQVTVICSSGGYADGGNKTQDGKSQDARQEGGGKAAEHSPSIQRSKVSLHDSALHDSVLSSPSCSPRVLRIRALRFGRRSFVGKLLDYASYYLGVAWKLMTMEPRPDRIVALTTPPYLSVLARAISRFRGADHAHWVMDLYPDVMVAHGMIADRSGTHRLLAGLARWGFGGNRCAAVVTLGPDMAERIETLMSRNRVEGRKPEVGSRKSEVESQQLVTAIHPGKAISGDGKPQATTDPTTCHGKAEGDDGSKIQNSKFKIISWLPLWGTGTGNEGMQVAALRKQRGWGEADMVVMYSGNMGLGHRFGEILAVARELAGLVEPDQDGRVEAREGGISKQAASERVRFVFFGGGKRRDEVEEFVSRHPDSGVEMHDYAPADILPTHLRSAEVHLVSLEPEWTGTMVPSKLQGVFAAGRPVIFIGSEASSIGRWVIESGGGWVVKPGDVAGLLTVLAEARNASVRKVRGEAALAYANVHFTKHINVEKMVGLYGRIVP